MKDPQAAVALKTLNDSSVDFAVRVCTKNSDWWALQCSLLEQIKLRFDAEGIEIPFPQTTVHVKHLPAPESVNAAKPVAAP